MVVLLALLVLGQEGIRLRDHSGAAKAVRELNCVGPGISCSSTSTFGTIFIDAGAGVGAVTPIYIDGGHVVCATASASSGGCLTSGTQDVSGYKDFKNGGQADDLWQFTGSFARNLGTHSIDVSQINYNGLQVGGPIVPTLDDNGVVVESRNLNMSLGPGLLVRSANVRDAGSYVSVNSGLPCDTTIFGIGPEGNLTVIAAPERDCSASSNILHRGMIKDGTAASGHVILQSYDELYLVVEGMLAKNHDAYLPLGVRPDPGDYPDGVVQTESDGGTYFAYAGSHGNLVSRTSDAQYGAWLFELRNDNGIGTGTKFLVDSYGGHTNSHGLTLGNFPECPGTSFEVLLDGAPAQFSYGASPGTQLWADDQEHYYVCKAAGWKQLKDEDDP